MYVSIIDIHTYHVHVCLLYTVEVAKYIVFYFIKSEIIAKREDLFKI